MSKRISFGEIDGDPVIKITHKRDQPPYVLFIRPELFDKESEFYKSGSFVRHVINSIEASSLECDSNTGRVLNADEIEMIRDFCQKLAGRKLNGGAI